MHAFNLNLSSYQNLSGIRIRTIEDEMMIALVPLFCEFEATSYNADGTVFCNFNQNEQMERYEYDAAGRPIKVFDQNGDQLKEFMYNVVLN